MDVIHWSLLGLVSIGAALAVALWVRLREHKREAARLESEHAAARTTLSETTSVANEYSRKLDVAESKFATAEQRLDEVRAERDLARDEHEALRGELSELRANFATLTETLEQERKAASEKLKLLTDAKEQMKLEFKELAAEVMTGQSTIFKEQNKEQIDKLLNPLRERLTFFQESLQTAHTDSAKERARLVEQIQQLAQTSSAMMSETSSLTRALKGEVQTQGAWGEMILENILAKSGLREGEEYVIQQSHGTEDGGRVRPDVIVHLPSGERVIIDSKVSLTAFDAYVKAEDESERSNCLRSHLASMRTHIKTLSAKDYIGAAGSGLDYVILFVPIEGALAAALQADSGLTAHAVENNVPIATPTTLMIALRTIANLWQVERRNRNAEAIAERAGRLYDKFVGFVTDLQMLGSRLDQTRKTFDGAMNKLVSGSGALVRQAEQLKEMGAKTAKALPAALISEIEMDKDSEVKEDSPSAAQIPQLSEGAAAE